MTIYDLIVLLINLTTFFFFLPIVFLQMKRVINKALSIFSPSKRSSSRKRPVDEFGASESPSLKRPKRVCEDLHAHLDAIERLQSTLLSLDKACSKDQLEIQRKYDAEKAPLLLQRRIETNKIPSFWATALGNHPATNAEAFLEDREILDLLTSIDLEDNIDDNGSYQLRFVFDSSCNPFFPQSELVRTVTILEDQTDQVTSTPISWAPGKRPKHPNSFFAWFSAASDNSCPSQDLGEVLRRDLWQNPYPYYLNLGPHS